MSSHFGRAVELSWFVRVAADSSTTQDNSWANYPASLGMTTVGEGKSGAKAPNSLSLSTRR